ncbi:Uncharacterised protein [BD1-7 clade bacterium]|uniref:Uncharacterized protein n=1 Tax=BD1-7 clade bacterium TaxID=2029982 RepID=A0A5S9QZW8_9GAMM|nr:Uncharacterised protein [BD1-7 clade bacterium]
MIEAFWGNSLSTGATAGRCQLEKFAMVSHEMIYQWIYLDKSN